MGEWVHVGYLCDQGILCNHVGMWDYVNDNRRICCNCGAIEKREEDSPQKGR